eukprot:scaffold180571_cov37-Tisochrysis_lutea.AAC.1
MHHVVERRDLVGEKLEREQRGRAGEHTPGTLRVPSPACPRQLPQKGQEEWRVVRTCVRMLPFTFGISLCGVSQPSPVSSSCPFESPANELHSLLSVSVRHTHTPCVACSQDGEGRGERGAGRWQRGDGRGETGELREGGAHEREEYERDGE